MNNVKLKFEYGKSHIAISRYEESLPLLVKLKDKNNN